MMPPLIFFVVVVILAIPPRDPGVLLREEKKLLQLDNFTHLNGAVSAFWSNFCTKIKHLLMGM